MHALIASLVCIAGIAYLFHLDRDEAVRNSKALWLPSIWIALSGSRPVSSWFGMGNSGNLAASLDGSPFDATVLGALIFLGLIVALKRWRRFGVYLPLLTPVILYSVYCVLSVSWSPYPLPALKRWSKDLGDVIMVLLILTDPYPSAAIRRIFSRVGFILLPVSVDLIRYTTIGRAWDADGSLAIVGITDNKNMLGLIVYLISLATVWKLCWLLMNRQAVNRKNRLIGGSVLLACGMYLLLLAHSSTSIGCFLLGGSLILVTSLRTVRKQPALVHVLCLGIIVSGALLQSLGAGEDLAHALGRQSNLSGRTYMWAAMFPAVTNPLIGVGFDSFWTSPNAEIFHNNLKLLHWYHAEDINEAHNGYIEVYLNLGWIGVCLIAAILANGYYQATKAFRRNPELGSLFLAFIMSGAVYSITEAGFRTLSPMWICILFSAVGAGAVNARLLGRPLKKTSKSRAIAQQVDNAELFPTAQPAYKLTDAEIVGRKHIW